MSFRLDYPTFLEHTMALVLKDGAYYRCSPDFNPEKMRCGYCEKGLLRAKVHSRCGVCRASVAVSCIFLGNLAYPSCEPRNSR